jgi:hypothetical protein
LKAGTWFLFIILSVAFLSVIIPFLLFLVRKKKNIINVGIKTAVLTNNNDPVQKIYISVSLF